MHLLNCCSKNGYINVVAIHAIQSFLKLIISTLGYESRDYNMLRRLIKLHALNLLMFVFSKWVIPFNKHTFIRMTFIKYLRGGVILSGVQGGQSLILMKGRWVFQG